jgi:glycosyltransferase involved in cell wall biosynthesis
MKKIFIFSNYSGGYGSEMSLADVYQAISDDYLVTTIMNPAVPIPQEYSKKYNVKELTFNVLSKKSLLPSPRSVLRLIMFLKKNKPDKVIANISVMPELYLACFICRIPLYIIVRESLIDFGKIFILYRLFLNICSKKIIANSQYTQSMFGKMRNVELLYNTIDDPIIDTSNEKKINYDFIYLGRLSQRKGVKILFDALRKLSDKVDGVVRIVVVGGVKVGEESLVEEMKQCESICSNISLTWVGFQSDPTSYIQSSKFMVAPSLLPETFGRTIIESGILGVPVVSSDVGAYHEINPLKDFIFKSGDSHSLTNKMLALLQLSESEHQDLKSYVIKDSRKYSFNNYQQNLKSILND